MARNLITDVAGVKVGNADDVRLASGVTAIVFDEPAVAAVDVRGGAPGTRDTELLDAHRTVERIDAIVLSGGSAFGLDAAVRRAGLAARAGPRLCDWRHPRADRVRRDAVRPAQRRRQELGPLSALSRSRLRGGGGRRPGLRAGHRRRRLRRDHRPATRAASARLRPSRATATPSARWWRSTPAAMPMSAPPRNSGRRRSRSVTNSAASAFRQQCRPMRSIPVAKGRPGENTTIAIVVTDAILTKSQAKQFAVMAQDGLARAIYPAHTTLDGDTVFAAATGRRALNDVVNEIAELGSIGANTLARAVARGVFDAAALSGGLPSWQDCHSGKLSGR